MRIERFTPFFVSLLFSWARLANTKQGKIMKLIVLYGDGNIGKTTTLKKVYEMLKNFSIKGVNCFKEYNADAHKANSSIQIDIRDVLVIDNQKYVQNCNITSEYENEYNYEDFKMEGHAIDKIKEWHKGNHVIEDLEECATRIKQQFADTHRYTSVGIVTEGDFGFESRSKGRNLYDNIKEIEFCDVVICACTKGKENVCVEDCVIKFSEEHKVTPCIVTRCSADVILAHFSNFISSDLK